MKTPWPTKKLGEICEENRKSPYKVENADNIGPFPFFTSGEAVLRHSEYLIDGENIFLATGGYAKIKYFNGKASYSGDTWSLKIKDRNILTKFVYYQILRILKFLDEALFRGSGLRHLQKREFLNLKIPLPPLPIQQKIVSILDTIQEAIDLQDKVIEKTKELKKSMMAEIFNSKVKSQKSKLKFKIQKWEKLGRICNLRKEQVMPKQEDKYIGLENIEPGETTIKKFASGSDVKSLKIKFYPQDILYGKLRPYLDKAVVVDFEGVCSTDLLVLRCNNKVLPKYLIYILHLPQFINFAVNTMSGTNHPRTSWSSLKNFLIPLPPLPEQQEIADILQTIDQKIEIEQKKKRLYEELFRVILNGLTSGKIDIEKIEVL